MKFIDWKFVSVPIAIVQYTSTNAFGTQLSFKIVRIFGVRMVYWTIV